MHKNVCILLGVWITNTSMHAKVMSLKTSGQPPNKTENKILSPYLYTIKQYMEKT